MVVEIQCCVNSTNQRVQRPSPSPESSGPLKKYYLTSRDFLRGKFLPGTLFRSWFLQWKHTEYHPKVPSSWVKFLRWKRGYSEFQWADAHGFSFSCSHYNQICGKKFVHLFWCCLAIVVFGVVHTCRSLWHMKTCGILIRSLVFYTPLSLFL